MCFQLTFAIITPALICGAFADRMKFSALVLFMILWPIFVYAPIAHWVWGGGFLGALGVLTLPVVRSCISTPVSRASFALSFSASARLRLENMSPYNLVCAVIGAALLWVGWFGFNAGSELAADGRAGMAMTVTQSPRRRQPWRGCSPNGSCMGSRACSASSPARSPVCGHHPGFGLRRPESVRCGSVPPRRRRLFLRGHDREEGARLRRLARRLRRARRGRHHRRLVDRRVRSGQSVATRPRACSTAIRTRCCPVLGRRWNVHLDGLRDLRDTLIVYILVGLRVSQAVEVEGLDINLHGEVVR